MPGIFGLVSDAGTSAHNAALERMARPLRRAAFVHAQSVDDSVALGVLGLAEGSPQVICQEEACLAFYGLIVDEDFQQEMREQGGAAQALLERFRHGGCGALSGLNGSYTLALWEPRPQRLTLIHDAIGYASLYYCHTPHGLWFAAEYKAIAQAASFDQRLDPTAIADLFLYQFPAGGRTPFQAIRALPPASRLTYQAGRLQVERFGPPVLRPVAAVETTTKTATAQDIEYADGLIFHLRRAVRRRMRPGTALLITGGLDSRIVAGLYCEEAPGAALATSTVGLPTGRDVVMGRRLSAALGLSHTHVPLGEDYLTRYAGPLTYQAESKIGAYASWILAEAPELRQAGLRYAMTGLFGNLVSGRHYPPELLQAQSMPEAIAAVETFFRPYLPGLTEIMRPQVMRQAAEESAQFLIDTFQAAPAQGLLPRFDWLVLQGRAAYAGNTADALGDVALALEPFLDNEVLDYALNTIPTEVRGRALFYYHMITRHLPQVAAVPDGRNDYSIMTDLRIRQRAWLSWLDSLRRRGLRRLLPGRYGSEARSSVPHAAAIRGGSKEYVQAVLGRVDALADLFDPSAVRAMLDDHQAGRRNAYMTLDSLLTTLLWHEQFCQSAPANENLSG